MPPLDQSGENHIPEAVRRTSARVEELARAAGMANVPAAEPSDDGVSANGETPASSETPAAPPLPPSPPAPPPSDDWEQKYRTLQGKYDSEIPGLRSQVNGLQQLLANLETRPPQQPVQPDPARAAPTVVELPAKDVDEYGQELIDAVRRWTRMEVQPLIDELRTKIDGLGTNFTKIERSAQETAVFNAREFVKASLDKDPVLGPVWKSINVDPAFLVWVKEADPFSGQIRQPLLQGAFDAGQDDRVKKFFNAYLNEHTATQVSPQAPPHTPEQPGTGRPTLEDFAAPGRGSASPPSGGAPSEKRIWSQPEIAAFYRDVNRGVYATREADKLRTEQDIIAAATEGRIK